MLKLAARFAGRVGCERGTGALKLTLSGVSADPPGQPLRVGFAAAAPAGLPAVLEDAVVEETAPGTFRITSAAGEWTLPSPAVHVHRDVAVPFYRAIPPRPVPLSKRAFWRLVLMLAGSRSGFALLRALRGSS
jgi:hypothetical protein